MDVIFWGTRGSLPFAVTSKMIQNKIKSAVKLAREQDLSSQEDINKFVENELPFSIQGGYGCNTACVEIKGGSEHIVCDAGTGLRDFGNRLLQKNDKQENRPPLVINIFLSHLHWDHIQGFPFFVPAFIPGNIINIFGFHEEIEEVFKRQQANPCFPVPLEAMQAQINFKTLDLNKEYTIAGIKIKGIKLNHPGGSFGYSFEKGGIKAVYASDSEHKEDLDDEDYKFIDFCNNADLLITDAQYSFLDAAHTKENWGHSSNIVVTELAVRSRVKQLCMFHHEPTCDDNDLERFLEDTKKYLNIYDKSSKLIINMAYDGMEIKLVKHNLIADGKMEIITKQQGNWTVFELIGKLDGMTAPELEKMVISQLDSDSQGAVLDMKSLDYISSGGLRAILVCKKKSDAADKKFFICELQKMVKEVFNIAGFSAFIDLDLSFDGIVKQ